MVKRIQPIFEAKFNRFFDAFHESIKRAGLRMAAAQFRHRSHVVAFGIALNDDGKFTVSHNWYNEVVKKRQPDNTIYNNNFFFQRTQIPQGMTL